MTGNIWGPRTSVYALYLFFTSVATQTVQQSLWNTPAGNAKDLSLTFTNDQTIPLSWNAVNSSRYFDASVTDVYLWCTSFDWNLNQYASLLKQSVDLSVPGNLAWTVDIPDHYLSISAKYVLRFKSPNTTYTSNSQELSSPGLLVLAADATPSGLTSSSTPTTVSSTPATTPVAVSSPSDTPAVPSPGLTDGARAGIGVGVSVGALALVSLAIFLLWRRRKSPSPAEGPALSIPDKENSQYQAYPQCQKRSQRAKPENPAELQGQSSEPVPAELGDGSVYQIG